MKQGRLEAKSDMHEMGIAASVLEAAEKEARLHPGHRVARIGLRIGEFAGVDTESLSFCFEAIVKSYGLPPVELDLEWCRVEDGKRGDELDLAYVELADSEEDSEVDATQSEAAGNPRLIPIEASELRASESEPIGRKPQEAVL